MLQNSGVFYNHDNEDILQEKIIQYLSKQLNIITETSLTAISKNSQTTYRQKIQVYLDYQDFSDKQEVFLKLKQQKLEERETEKKEKAKAKKEKARLRELKWCQAKLKENVPEIDTTYHTFEEHLVKDKNEGKVPVRLNHKTIVFVSRDKCIKDEAGNWIKK